KQGQAGKGQPGGPALFGYERVRNRMFQVMADSHFNVGLSIFAITNKQGQALLTLGNDGKIRNRFGKVVGSALPGPADLPGWMVLGGGSLRNVSQINARSGFSGWLGVNKLAPVDGKETLLIR